MSPTPALPASAAADAGQTSSAGVEAAYAEPAPSVSAEPFRVYLDPKFGAPSTFDGVPGTSSWARVESAPEVEIVLDRSRAAARGVPLVGLSLAIRAATDGVLCGRVVLAVGDGSRTLEMRLRLSGKSGSDSTDPIDASLPSADGRLIPLSDVARRQVNAGAGDEALYAVDGSPVVAFEGRLAPGAQLDAVDAELRKRFGDGVMRVPLDPD